MAGNEAALVTLLLTQRLVDGDTAALKASEYWDLVDLVDRVGGVSALLGRSADALVRDVGLDAGAAERIVRRLDQATQVAFAVDELALSGVRVVTAYDEAFPSVLRRLGRGTPPLLYVAGEPSALSTGGLGIVGSRDVAPEGADAAGDVARLAAASGLTVISGGAKGVDRLAMNGALERGGTVVGVLAESLLRTTRDSDIRRAVTDGALTLCTPYKPSAGFSVANAMGRNKLIYSLSTATIVIASDHNRGGTWSGAVEALKHGFAPVLVWMGEGATDGNRELVSLGAAPITKVEDVVPLDPFVAAAAAVLGPPSHGPPPEQLSFYG